MQFFNSSYKNIIHDKIIFLEAALVVKKHDAGGLRWTKYQIIMALVNDVKYKSIKDCSINLVLRFDIVHGKGLKHQ